MVDILHRVGIIASPEKVYDALTTIEGLAGWWTEGTSGTTDVGGVIEFQFDPGGIDMEVVALEPHERVDWKVVDGPEEWIGTTIGWQLTQEGSYTIVQFRHQGWRDPVDFMHHCSTKWAVFLLSLRDLLENGKGAPAPRDVKIDTWN